MPLSYYVKDKQNAVGNLASASWWCWWKKKEGTKCQNGNFFIIKSIFEISLLDSVNLGLFHVGKCDTLKCQKCCTQFCEILNWICRGTLIDLDEHQSLQKTVNSLSRPDWKLKSILPSFPPHKSAQLQSSKTTLTAKAERTLRRFKDENFFSETKRWKAMVIDRFAIRNSFIKHDDLKYFSLRRLFNLVNTNDASGWLCRASINSESP